MTLSSLIVEQLFEKIFAVPGTNLRHARFLGMVIVCDGSRR